MTMQRSDGASVWWLARAAVPETADAPGRDAPCVNGRVLIPRAFEQVALQLGLARLAFDRTQPLFTVASGEIRIGSVAVCETCSN